MGDGPEYLEEVAKKLRQKKRQWRRFETILSAFGYSRRRQTVIDKIREELAKQGLQTSPEVSADLPITTSVTFSLLTGSSEEDVTQDGQNDSDEDGDKGGDVEDVEDLRTVLDVSITVGNLAAADREPACLPPDATIKKL